MSTPRDQRPMVWCDHCKHYRNHEARGLCSVCYRSLFEHGLHILFERTTREAEEVVTDYFTIKINRPQLTMREIADQLGMTHAALDQAIVRWRRRNREEQRS